MMMMMWAWLRQKDEGAANTELLQALNSSGWPIFNEAEEKQLRQLESRSRWGAAAREWGKFFVDVLAAGQKTRAG